MAGLCRIVSRVVRVVREGLCRIVSRVVRVVREELLTKV